MKKAFFVLLLLLMSTVSPCSAESWQLVGSELGTDRDYYVDFDSAWSDNLVNGGGLAKIQSKDTGYSVILSLRFVSDQSEVFDVAFSNGKAYGPDGNLLYETDLNLRHNAEADSILSKVCSAMKNISESKI